MTPIGVDLVIGFLPGTARSTPPAILEPRPIRTVNGRERRRALAAFAVSVMMAVMAPVVVAPSIHAPA